MNLVSSSSALRWNSIFEGQKGSSEYSADPVTASWTLRIGASGLILRVDESRFPAMSGRQMGKFY